MAAASCTKCLIKKKEIKINPNHHFSVSDHGATHRISLGFHLQISRSLRVRPRTDVWAPPMPKRGLRFFLNRSILFVRMIRTSIAKNNDMPAQQCPLSCYNPFHLLISTFRLELHRSETIVRFEKYGPSFKFFSSFMKIRVGVLQMLKLKQLGQIITNNQTLN